MMNLEGRHPTTVRLAGFFSYGHLPPHLQAVSKPCHDLAETMVGNLPDNDELWDGLRDLVRAKDWFVRAVL